MDFSLVLNGLLLIIVLFYFVNPMRIPFKRPNVKVGLIRLCLGAAICLSTLSIAIKLNGGSYLFNLLSVSQKELNESKDLSAVSDSSDSKALEMFKKKLNQYSTQIQNDIFTKKCINPSKKAISLKQTNFSEETIGFAALLSCSCITYNLKGTDEFKAAKKLLEEGKSQEIAMSAFTDIKRFIELIKPCSNN